MMPWFWLFLQCACAAMICIIMQRRVFPHVAACSTANAALDVWCPLAVALPLIAWTCIVPQQVAPLGWPSFGAWASLLSYAAACTLLTRRPQASLLSLEEWQLLLVLSVSSALMLLFGAAHELTVWPAQAALTIGAILLWIRTPSHSDSPPTQSEVQLGSGILLAILLSAAASISSILAGDKLVAPSVAASVLTAFVVITMGCHTCGPRAALRIGGWAAVYAMYFAIGALSLRHVARLVLEIWSSPSSFARNGSVSIHIAFGFGTYALEAALALIAVGLLVTCRLLLPGWSRPAGIGLLLGTIALVFIRLGSFL